MPLFILAQGETFLVCISTASLLNFILFSINSRLMSIRFVYCTVWARLSLAFSSSRISYVAEIVMILPYQLPSFISSFWCQALHWRFNIQVSPLPFSIAISHFLSHCHFCYYYFDEHVHIIDTLRANLPCVVATACHTSSHSANAREEIANADVIVATHGTALDLLRHYPDVLSMSKVRAAE